jgi:LysM repeat protein
MAEQFLAVGDQELTKVAGGRYLGPTFVYVIQEGDTLPRLAQRFGTTVRLLREINSLQDPNRFQVGLRLLIPQK